MNNFTKTTLLVSACLAAGITQATAQAQNDFARDRDLAVLDRPRPEYDAIGIPLDSFLLYPRLNIVSGYDDNIYATDTNTKADGIFQIQPSLALKSQWSEHELDFDAHSSINQYFSHGTEDTNDYGAALNGRLDILASTNITAHASYDLETEARGDESAAENTVNPVQFSVWTGQLSGMHQFNRLQVSVTGTWDDYNYLDGRDGLGNVIDQHFRNVQDTGETVRADYAISPDTAVFLSGNLNQHSYPVQPPLVANDYNSTGFEALGGVNFQITNLVTGELGAGYFKQDYPNVAGQNLGSLALHGTVQWFPTELTTVSVKVDRLVADSSLQGSAGYLTTGGSVQVDHELRYNVILSGIFSYNDDSFQGIDRNDGRWTAGIGAKYLLTREVGIGLNYNHDNQISSGANRYINFNIDRVMLNLVLQE